MTTTETIEWHPASEPPAHFVWVLWCRTTNKAGGIAEVVGTGEWVDSVHGLLRAPPTHWAELPRGPQA